MAVYFDCLDDTSLKCGWLAEWKAEEKEEKTLAG